MGNAVPTRRGVGGGSSPDAAARATGTRVGATPGGGTQGRVCVAGPVFLDVVMGGLQHAPRPGEEQWVSDCAVMPGGAANQAVALARLGAPTSLVTHLGEDDAGRLVQTMLERDGIDLSGAVRLPRQSVTTSLAFGGDRAMTTFGTDATPPLADLAAVPWASGSAPSSSRAVRAGCWPGPPPRRSGSPSCPCRRWTPPGLGTPSPRGSCGRTCTTCPCGPH